MKVGSRGLTQSIAISRTGASAVNHPLDISTTTKATLQYSKGALHFASSMVGLEEWSEPGEPPRRLVL
jgi:hypothetical protein